jgi:hypothetical protein
MIIKDTESVDIHTSRGPIRTHLFRSATEGRYPGLLLFSEIFQVTGLPRLAVSSVPLLEWMTLRGSHALLDSPTPSLPCAMRRDVQRWFMHRCNHYGHRQ